MTRRITAQNWRLNQLWDWGHNCKILGQTKEQVQEIEEAMRSEYSAEEWARFWEGYNAPPTRSAVVVIKL